MPDSPDYQKYLPGSVRFSLQDMGELAARIGSPSKYDRRGEVVFMDDFRYGMSQWNVAPGGYLNTITLNSNLTFQSPYSVKFYVSGQVGSNGSISRSTHPSEIGRLGFETTFCCYDDLGYVKIELAIVDNNITTWSRIYLSQTDSKIYYTGNDGSSHALGSLYPLHSSSPVFRTAKLVTDFSKLEYARFMLDDTEYDLSGTPLYQTAGNGKQICQYSIGFTGKSTIYSNIYLCNTIGTANEP